MSAQKPRAYRFATETQWNACLFESVQRIPGAAALRFRPHALYGGTPLRLQSPGAGAPAVVDADEILWHDNAGQVHRWSAELARTEVTTAPGALGGARRIVVSAGNLWVAGDAPISLQSFDARTYTRRLGVDLSPARVLDLTGDGRGGVYVLLEEGGVRQCARVDHAGVPGERFALRADARPMQLAWLRGARRLITLSEDGTRLHWFVSGNATSERDVALNWPRPCFVARWLAADAADRVLVAGMDGKHFGGDAYVLAFDAEGRPLQHLRIPGEPTGLAAARGLLLVSTADALLRYSLASKVPDETAEVHASFLTPMLRSPAAQAPRRWMRVEARAALPPGTALEVSYASTENKELIAEAAKISADHSLSPGDRSRKLRERLAQWTVHALEGADATATLSEASAPLSIPLFDVRDSHLWVCVTLRSAAGAALPELESLEVIHSASTLMDHLPAIYRRQEAQPGSFLRALVGVLEATTQSLDARIGAMGAKANPASAPREWLDFTARWLGLPWSDALDERQKRALLRAAPDIAAKRGTRAGLEAFLESVVPTQPGQPRRYRIVDVAVDLGLAMAGGAGCRGSTLPAVIAGLPRSALVLGRQAEIGRARLPCPGQPPYDIAARFLGHVRVDVAATAEERERWEPWLATLLAAMVPATVRLRLRWLSPAMLLRGDRLDEGLELKDRPVPRLGTDAIPGLARLPDAPPRLFDSLGPGSRLH